MNLRTRARLSFEQLEDRTLLAGSIFLSGAGVLTMRGTPRSDRATVRFAGNRIRAAISGGANLVRFFKAARVQQIVFDGRGGNDRIINLTDRPSWFNGVPTSPAASSDGLNADQALILQMTNNWRAQNGLPRLAVNALLQRAAQAHAENMARQDKYGDDDQNGHILDGHDFVWRLAQVGYDWSSAGENVAYNFGYANAAETMANQWWDSPGHRANILDADFTEIGIGIARGASGRTYGVQLFGRPY